MKKLLKHPNIIIAVCLILTAVLGLQIMNLKIDNSIRQFIPQKDGSYARLLETEDQFGSVILVGVSLETDGKTILTPENIAVIDRITKRAQELDNVEKVQSLTNIDYVESKDGALVAGTLLGDDYSGSDEDMDAIKERIVSWNELYNRVIISDDFRATQMLITVEKGASDEVMEAVVKEVRQIAKEETKGTSLSMRIFGEPVLSEQAKAFMIKDLAGLIPLVIVVVLISLLFSFGTLDGTILPLLTVLISTVWTVGIMSIAGATFSIVSSVIPVALIAVGSAYGIHVLTHYYVALDKNTEPLTGERHAEIIIEGLKDVKNALILAGFTTIIGFISLISSPIVPLHSFAIYSALGVFFSLALSYLLIPAILIKKKPEHIGRKSKLYQKKVAKIEEKIAARNGNERGERRQGDGLFTVYKALAGTKARMFCFIVILLAISAFGLSRLVVDTSMVNYFPPTSEFRKDVAYVDSKFAGTNNIYFTVKSTGDKDITNPEILKAMDDMQTTLETNYEDIGKIVSFTTFLKRMNQVMHIPETTSAETEGYSDDLMGEDATSDEGFDSFDSFDSFGDDAAFSSDDSFSFGDDSFGSFGDEEGFSSFESEDADAETEEYVDPNVAYAAELSRPMTTEEALSLLQKAYISAGGKYATVDQIVTELEKDLNYRGMAYYEVPYDPAKYPVETREELSNLVAQYLLLFSGSLDEFNDDALEPKVSRMQVQLRSHNTESTKNIIDTAQAYADAHFPEGYTFEACGLGEMEYAMTKLVVKSQLTSLLFSLLSVLVILSIAFKSVLAGIVGAIPLAITILLNYMVMGLLGINLDLVTSIIASVAIGVGIDYTIHFMETFRNEHLIAADLETATRETFRKSGHGIVTNAIAVGFGFLVLCLSNFEVLRYIGILVAIVMFTSSMLAMTVIPGILNIFDPQFMGGRKKDKKNKKSK
jgi:Predicted exporters of the RND superfamily